MDDCFYKKSSRSSFLSFRSLMKCNLFRMRFGRFLEIFKPMGLHATETEGEGV